MFHPTLNHRFVLTALASALYAASGLTAAQTTPATPDAQKADAEKIESIVITGTLIQRPEITATSPVTTLTKETLELSRALNIERVVTQLPQFQGSFGAVSNGNDSRGAATLDLRNLGQNRTLLLIDGKRGTPFGFRNSFDVNTLPGPLVKRVEVLTGGAAAIYGADAVAGVVNFILNDKFRGVEVGLTGNIADAGDSREVGANITAGTSLGGRGSVTGYLGVSSRDGLLKGERDFSNPQRNDAGPITQRAIGGTFTRSDNASVFDFSSLGGAVGQARFAFNDAGTLGSTAQTSIVSPREALTLPADRVSGALFFNFDLNDRTSLYGRAMASNTVVKENLGPANTSTSFLVRRDNPFITPELARIFGTAYNRDFAGNVGGTDAFLVTVARSLPELGDRVLRTDRTGTQLQVGAKGELSNNVRYDVYAQYGDSDESTEIAGDGILTRLQQAGNVRRDASGKIVCVDPSNGCVPINVFGPNSISAEAAAFVGQQVTQSRKRTQAIIGATAQFNSEGLFRLPGGAADLAVGIETRREKGEVLFDDVINDGTSFNQGRRLDFGGVIKVNEIFMETRLPLVSKAPFVKELAFEGAYRHSRDHDTGTANAWKVGGEWAVDDNVRFRGSKQTVLRAPNIGERFGVLSFVALAGRTNDPCSNITANGALAAKCAANGAPTGNYTTDLSAGRFYFGGSANIKPEQGRTFTIGAVLTPSFAKGLSFTADYYDIRIDNAISAYGAQVVTTGCFVLGIDQFCQRIKRGNNGQIESVDSTDSNIAILQVKGFDLGANYRMRLDSSSALTFGYNADLTRSFQQLRAPGAAVVECAGRFGPTCGAEVNRALPKYRHNFSTTWSTPGWTVQGTWRHFGAVEDDVLATTYTTERINAYNYFDLSGSWNFNKNVKLIAGIDNVADKKPPFVGTQQFAGNTLPTSYDVVGRRFGLSLVYKN